MKLLSYYFDDFFSVMCMTDSHSVKLYYESMPMVNEIIIGHDAVVLFVIARKYSTLAFWV